MNSEKVPIIILLYNRPETTKEVCKAISIYQPDKLYVVADGPKDVQDKIRCDQTRSIIDMIDWNCKIHKNYSEKNMGCGFGVSSGISWAFNSCERAIILVDDCIPDSSFFYYCEQLLEKYKDDTRIGMISGNNYGFPLYDSNISYSFSKHGHITGWATWKRCWEKFNYNLNIYDKNELELIRSNISANEHFVTKWWSGVEAVINGDLDAWSLQWGVARYANNYLTIRPKENLVAHIGYGEFATHTKGKPNPKYTATGSLEFPLEHPRIIAPDKNADKKLEEDLFPVKQPRDTYLQRIIIRLKNMIPFLNKTF